MHAFFSCATNQSSQGYCNNCQNKHDDPCPTTVLNLTNLGQCKKFLMHPVIPVHLPCDWPDASPCITSKPQM